MSKALLACALFLLSVSAVKSSEHLQAAASAVPDGEYYFFESFGEGWKSKWVNTTSDEYTGEWEWEKGYSDVSEDYGLKMGSAGQKHALSSAFEKAIEVQDSTFVVQYEVKATNGLACDGAYIKLLQKGSAKQLSKFDNNVRYTIMFGPDRCGSTDKVHFILQHQNPVTKQWEEKHAKGTPASSAADKMTHLYTLIIRPDNSFEIKVDMQSKLKGDLLKDLEPAVNPPKEIDDPEDVKPADWVDEPKMDDPKATKPEDWDETLPEYIEDANAKKPSGWMDDEPLRVPDPEAKKPDDWDDEEDGDWEAPIIDNPKCKVGCGEWKRPTIRNPAYKGKWYPPKIDNPAYKGPWAPRKIPNKDWFEDLHPHNMHPMDAIGIELLTNAGGIVFDNILITNSEQVATSLAEKTWKVRNKEEAAKAAKNAPGMVQNLGKALNDMQAQISELYKEKPVVVIGIFGVCALMMILLVYICISPAQSAPKAKEASSDKKVDDKKKTDEPTPDDKETTEDKAEDAEDEEIEEISTTGASSSKPKKRSSRKD
uniref:Calnexin n=1 Tax=Hanusia phi TaxID=3032 RepID=A0A7S0DZ29_9CRYP|mmetsp:Transcript_12629/g.29055  ORF Transcript_12629/g.29055 Transcript_12629/m.29055 type:complete len:539 (+) Transcript_12629:55-1671(+)